MRVRPLTTKPDFPGRPGIPASPFSPFSPLKPWSPSSLLYTYKNMHAKSNSLNHTNNKMLCFSSVHFKINYRCFGFQCIACDEAQNRIKRSSLFRMWWFYLFYASSVLWSILRILTWWGWWSADTPLPFLSFGTRRWAASSPYRWGSPKTWFDIPCVLSFRWAKIQFLELSHCIVKNTVETWQHCNKNVFRFRKSYTVK